MAKKFKINKIQEKARKTQEEIKKARINRQKSVFMQKWQKLSKKIAKMQKSRIFSLEPRSRELFACQKPVFQKSGFFKTGF